MFNRTGDIPSPFLFYNMRTHLLIIRLVLWIPVLLTSLFVYLPLFFLNSIIFHVLNFILEHSFKSCVQDVKESSKGTHLEKTLNEIINKFYHEEE